MTDLNLPKPLLLCGGIAAIVSAVTTFLLGYLPSTYEIGPGFEGVIALHNEPGYIGRLWVNFIHVFLALFAYGVTACLVFKRSPVWVTIGITAFVFWCLTEALGVSIKFMGRK